VSEPPQRSRFDRLMDRVPVFGRLRRVQGWIRRKKGWVYLILAIVVLFVVKPLLTILAEIFKILRPMISVLFDNPVGRFVFYNVLALALLYWIWRKMRARVMRVIGLRCMRHFLDGMQLMMLNRWRLAIGCFEKVVGWSHWIRLEDAVPEHRDIAADARVKIATCHHRLGNSNEALAWLKRVREKDVLTEHVRRNHAELHALAYDLSDELEEETVLKELEKTQTRDRSNRRVLLALRERLEGAGDLERARIVGRRLASVTEGREKEEAERDLALLEFRLAHKALGEGDGKRMRKALKATSGDAQSALMLGDLALEEGKTKTALKAWSRAVSLPVFDRMAKLLADGTLDPGKERDLLLRYFPFAGTFIVLAEHYFGKGDYKKARAALDKVLEAAGENIHVLRLYAACLEGDGDSAGAAELYRRALSLSFA